MFYSYFQYKIKLALSQVPISFSQIESMDKSRLAQYAGYKMANSYQGDKSSAVSRHSDWFENHSTLNDGGFF